MPVIVGPQSTRIWSIWTVCQMVLWGLVVLAPLGFAGYFALIDRHSAGFVVGLLLLPIAVAAASLQVVYDYGVEVDLSGVTVRRLLSRDRIPWSAVSRVFGREVFDYNLGTTGRFITLEVRDAYLQTKGPLYRWRHRRPNYVDLRSTAMLNTANSRAAQNVICKFARANLVPCDLPGKYRSPWSPASPVTYPPDKSDRSRS